MEKSMEQGGQESLHCLDRTKVELSGLEASHQVFGVGKRHGAIGINTNG